MRSAFRLHRCEVVENACPEAKNDHRDRVKFSEVLNDLYPMKNNMTWSKEKHKLISSNLKIGI